MWSQLTLHLLIHLRYLVHCAARTGSALQKSGVLTVLLTALTSTFLSACSGSSAEEQNFREIPAGIARPTQLDTTLAVGSIAAGGSVTCLITPANDPYCLGTNENGQLASDQPMEMCDGGAFPCSATPLPVNGLHAVVQIGDSVRHACALTSAGDVYCWGYGEGGQLGDGLRVTTDRPVLVSGQHQFAQLSVGVAGFITCALTTGGEAYCWGPGGGYGGIGNGTEDLAAEPAAVATSLRFTHITVGEAHACAIASGGDAYCWGRNAYGVLGTGHPGRSSVPVPVTGGLTFVAINSGPNHTCALTADGTAYCWGLSLAIGADAPSTGASAPTAVDTLQRFTRLAAGYDFNCGLTAAGTVWCWGTNLTGALGDGTFTDHPTPAQVRTTQQFTSLVAGGGHVCAQTAAAEVYCWGSNNAGQLGRAAF